MHMLAKPGSSLAVSKGCCQQQKQVTCPVGHCTAASAPSARPDASHPALCASQLHSSQPCTSRQSVVANALPSSLTAPCQMVSAAVRFYHLCETNDFHDVAGIVTPDVTWRQRGLLQGKRTYTGAEAVHTALLNMHAAYQDLTYTVNTYAEEEGRVALFWTATGTNRMGLFGMSPSFKRSTFSGVSLVQLHTDGRIREVIEYRQPTHEEMAAFLRQDLPDQQHGAVDRLLARGHAAPASSGGSYCQLPVTRSIDPMWRVRAMQVATEWVENWTPGPDLEEMVRDDIEEYNIYSWPDFDQDVKGRDALEERRSRSSQDAVVIRETVADSTTNVVVVHWFDFEQAPASAARASASSAAASTAEPAKEFAAMTAPPKVTPPKQQAARTPSSVEVKNGQLRVHLSQPPARRSALGSEDDIGGEVFSSPSSRLHKVRGVTLFRLDDDCKLAWMVTFRELKCKELDTYLVDGQSAAATAVPPASR
ncbi:hypothetical protein Agub_g5747 [Astrephomene gubernaculifera]|uniref:SnoaL-like domain-containing protein n=1 Tax=Astrephomene gubernaculifera TaxID=47775 RepID=A0AAD3DNR6_9CHLO|nr:hypothetical protein Agub_g5747 [Astrephomene gubernaculifera]